MGNNRYNVEYAGVVLFDGGYMVYSELNKGKLTAKYPKEEVTDNIKDIIAKHISDKYRVEVKGVILYDVSIKDEGKTRTIDKVVLDRAA